MQTNLTSLWRNEYSEKAYRGMNKSDWSWLRQFDREFNGAWRASERHRRLHKTKRLARECNAHRRGLARDVSTRGAFESVFKARRGGTIVQKHFFAMGRDHAHARRNCANEAGALARKHRTTIAQVLSNEILTSKLQDRLDLKYAKACVAAIEAARAKGKPVKYAKAFRVPCGSRI